MRNRGNSGPADTHERTSEQVRLQRSGAGRPVPRMGKSPRKYAVSNFGRWRNLSTRGAHTPLRDHKKGYCRVLIRGKSKERFVLIHHFVHVLHNDPELKEFFPGATVDHEDRDVDNNCASNLSWKSASEQVFNQKRQRRCVDYSTIDDEDLEEWVGYGPHFQISSYGRCKCFFNQPGGMKRGVAHVGRANNEGYVEKKFEGKMKKMHRVVLEAFGVEPPDAKHTHVAHIDGIRTNNQLCNLRWCTPKMNMKNRAKRKRRETSIPVQYRIKGTDDWKSAFDAKDAAEITGCCQNRIAGACNPNNIHHKRVFGRDYVRYEFRYVTNDKDLPSEVWKEVDPDDWFPGGKYYLFGSKE